MKGRGPGEGEGKLSYFNDDARTVHEGARRGIRKKCNFHAIAIIVWL
jgi:hypothetical protein